MATKPEDITPTTLADVVPESAKGDPATVASTQPAAAPAEKEKENAQEGKAPVEAGEKAKDEVSAAKDNTTASAAEPVTAPTDELKKLDISPEKKATEESATAAVAAAPVPATTGTTEKAEPIDSTPAATDGELVWPETPAEHPLTKLFGLVDSLVQESGHDEVYGIKLSSTSNVFHTKLILQKFLRANQNDLEKAKQQLLDTLKWRKEFDPIKAAGETFDKDKFDGLGYILTVEGVPESANKKDVVTFNVYGAVKDNKKTFGDLDTFLRWRVGLMERSVQKLDLASATKPIPNYNEGPDPYQGFQVHDYLQVTFLRQDPAVKAASKATINLLGRHYPETLSRKFFVNVPVVMGWLYQATKLIVAKETAKKFTVLSYGNQLVSELGQGVPKAYGGTSEELAVVGEGVNLGEVKA
ncbi:CRAL/TRIO domain-containing protein [Periconia macrospinosa]|uniref:Phosphatidylinositol transfer protein SFH5 n=1 Tax=Periconia macrospinosa TaxID=97972 RepID=A0A2V1DTZ6_9PLEO|nr:CRAL/TRIO domain-containing protein [Periconia macrospinosa]